MSGPAIVAIDATRTTNATNVVSVAVVGTSARQLSNDGTNDSGTNGDGRVDRPISVSRPGGCSAADHAAIAPASPPTVAR